MLNATRRSICLTIFPTMLAGPPCILPHFGVRTRWQLRMFWSHFFGEHLVDKCTLLRPGKLVPPLFKSAKGTQLEYARSGSTKTFSQMGSSEMIWMPIVEDSIFRFDSNEVARKEAWPSLSFMEPKIRDTKLDHINSQCSQPTYKPHSDVNSGLQTVTLELPQGCSFYGTGEVGGTLERTGKRIFTWNSDAWGYGKSTTALYQSHPWVFVVLPDGNTFGVLADTTRRCEVDLRRESKIKFSADYPYPVITFGPYPTPQELLVALSHAIGTIAMPPKWALGYHQCRWSYEPDSRVHEVATTFRKKEIPCDVIWMDIDYMDGFRCFTFDPEKFSDPQALATSLNEIGFKCVWMLDPGIKREKGYPIYETGCACDAWILRPDGEIFVGDVWPGPCVFPDFTRSEVRDWWARLVKDFVGMGVDGVWNDMNEPTVFKTVSKTMSSNNFHKGDEELGGHQKHLHYHNVYGMLMARSTYEGMLLANANKRPFVLTRAAYIGSQRFAATWTGDNLSNWDHLHMSIPMALNLGLSGQPLVGPDIGGFAGDSTPRLFARWMGIGALLPFARGHTETGTIDHEPWSFGDECENICRLALKRRYHLLPLFYTLFYFAHVKGLPVVTPVFFADLRDTKLRKIDDSFLLGSVLVCSSTHPLKRSDPANVNLPVGIWKRFNFDDDHPDLPLLYLKAGAIIPVGPSIQFTNEAKFEDEVTLIVALDEHGKAEGFLYEDSGDGFEFKQGQFLLTNYKAELVGEDVCISLESVEGAWSRPKRRLKVNLLLGEGAQVQAQGTDGETIKLRMPSSKDIEHLVQCSRSSYLEIIEKTGILTDADVEHDELKGVGAPKVPIELHGSNLALNVLPWIGGRITSMIHKPTGMELLWSRVESGGYEEYTSSEYRSAGCAEQYDIVRRHILELNGEDIVHMEANVGDGLSLMREIAIPKSSREILYISSKIVAKAVGAGAGGFSRISRLRIHPSFQVIHPAETYVKFKALNGTDCEINADVGETDKPFSGDNRPNGCWMLIDKAAGIVVVNRFKLDEVEVCHLHWGPGICNLELWSEERPVSKDSPLSISHEYQVMSISDMAAASKI